MMIKEKKEKEIITKKDLSYIIAFLGITIVLVFSWRAGDISVLVNQISLVGSVSSILLALIAIGYAFFQANNSSWENKQMIDTLTLVNKKVEELGEIKDEMVVIKNELNSFKEVSNDGMVNMMSAISDLPNKLNFEAFSELLKEQGITIPTEAESGLKIKYQEKINNEVNKLKDEVSGIDSKVRQTIMEYLNEEVKAGEVVSPGQIIKKLLFEGIEVHPNTISSILKKLSYEGGLIQIAMGKSSNGNTRIRYYKTHSDDDLDSSGVAQ